MTDPRSLAGEVEEQRLRIADGEVAQIAAHARAAVATICEEAVLPDGPEVARLQIHRDAGDRFRREDRKHGLAGRGEAHLDEIFLAREPRETAGVIEREEHEARCARQSGGAEQDAIRGVLLQRGLREDPYGSVLRDGEIARAD